MSLECVWHWRASRPGTSSKALAWRWHETTLWWSHEVMLPNPWQTWQITWKHVYEWTNNLMRWSLSQHENHTLVKHKHPAASGNDLLKVEIDIVKQKQHGNSKCMHGPWYLLKLSLEKRGPDCKQSCLFSTEILGRKLDSCTNRCILRRRVQTTRFPTTQENQWHPPAQVFWIILINFGEISEMVQKLFPNVNNFSVPSVHLALSHGQT